MSIKLTLMGHDAAAANPLLGDILGILQVGTLGREVVASVTL